MLSFIQPSFMQRHVNFSDPESVFQIYSSSLSLDVEIPQPVSSSPDRVGKIGGPNSAGLVTSACGHLMQYVPTLLILLVAFLALESIPLHLRLASGSSPLEITLKILVEKSSCVHYANQLETVCFLSCGIGSLRLSTGRKSTLNLTLVRMILRHGSLKR